jgi:hypothetical protein
MTRNGDFLSLNNIQAARNALRTDGYLMIEPEYSSAACELIVRFIDDHGTDTESETHYGGTELRIWNAQRKDEGARHFYDKCNVFMSCLLGQDTEAYTLLAIRNKPLHTADKESRSGRWHIDSIRTQLKMFLFLNGSTKSSGPLEFLPGTHEWRFKLKVLCDGTYGKPWHFVGRSQRPYQRLSDEWVSGLAAKGHRPLEIVCRPGAVLVINTSAIHRARPCTAGSRYALTAYFK